MFNSKFYDNSILSGTKIQLQKVRILVSFTITQFFQVLKSANKESDLPLVLR